MRRVSEASRNLAAAARVSAAFVSGRRALSSRPAELPAGASTDAIKRALGDGLEAPCRGASVKAIAAPDELADDDELLEGATDLGEVAQPRALLDRGRPSNSLFDRFTRT